MSRKRLPLISDLRHFCDALEPGSAVPRSRRNIAAFLARIVAASTAWEEPLDRPIVIRCRRRPGRRPCGAHLEVDRYQHPFGDAGEEQITWRCPRCGDEGEIHGWWGTRWDLRPRPGSAEGREHDPPWQFVVRGDELEALRELLPDPPARDAMSDRDLYRMVAGAGPLLHGPGVGIAAPDDPVILLAPASTVAKLGRLVEDALPRARGKKRRILEAALLRVHELLEDGDEEAELSWIGEEPEEDEAWWTDERVATSYRVDGRVPEQEVRAFLVAARQLCSGAPWEVAAEDQLMHVRLPGFVHEGWTAAVMGAMSPLAGLLLVREPGTKPAGGVTEGAADADRACLLVTLVPPELVSRYLADDARELGWDDTATSGVYPVLTAVGGDGSPRPVTPEDYELAALCMAAVERFVRESGPLFSAEEPRARTCTVVVEDIVPRTKGAVVTAPHTLPEGAMPAGLELAATELLELFERLDEIAGGDGARVPGPGLPRRAGPTDREVRGDRGGRPPTLHQLRITLQDIRPPIWRRVVVPSDVTLAELHHVIQAVMGWLDYHLHEFEIDGIRYVSPEQTDDEYAAIFDEPPRDERAAELRQVAPEAGDSIEYTYDFGDDWKHGVVVEKVLPPDPKRSPAACVAGKRACPPEDCGGPPGYEELRAALADPRHPSHDADRDWADDLDPERFDVGEANARLGTLRSRARRRSSRHWTRPAPVVR